MNTSGLNKIYPHPTDYSLVHTFGDVLDPKGLPKSFSIYDGRPIPNQMGFDYRFSPPVRPLPQACVAETITFEAGIKDKQTYPPDDFYMAIPPGIDGMGRDIRDGLKTAIERGFRLPDGTVGEKELAYFNCYGYGAIDDFDATRLGLWINQNEKRGVIVGTWWYPEFASVGSDGILPMPSFNTRTASLHCHLITGFDSTYKADYVEDISWQGDKYGKKGIDMIQRETYNALMQQPFTGAFTITDKQGKDPVPVGYQAVIDHLVYYVRSIFHV